MIYSGNSNTSPTSDTPLAAYLQTEGFEIIEIEHLEIANRKKSVFHFTNDSSKLQEHIRLYHAGKARVEPSLYLRNYHTLIRKIREGLPA